jgi:hypothetical protein
MCIFSFNLFLLSLYQYIVRYPNWCCYVLTIEAESSKTPLSFCWCCLNIYKKKIINYTCVHMPMYKSQKRIQIACPWPRKPTLTSPNFPLPRIPFFSGEGCKAPNKFHFNSEALYRGDYKIQQSQTTDRDENRTSVHMSWVPAGTDRPRVIMQLGLMRAFMRNSIYLPVYVEDPCWRWGRYVLELNGLPTSFPKHGLLICSWSRSCFRQIGAVLK